MRNTVIIRKIIGIFYRWFATRLKTSNRTPSLQSNIDTWIFLKYIKLDPSTVLAGGVLLWVYSVAGSTNETTITENSLENLSNNFDRLLQGMKQLIERFNNTLTNNNIVDVEVVNDKVGIVDYDISEQAAQRISNMLGIIKDTIHQRAHQIEDLVNSIRNIDEDLYQSLLARFELAKQAFSHWTSQ